MRLEKAMRVTNSEGVGPQGVRSRHWAVAMTSAANCRASSWRVPTTVIWTARNFSMAARVF
jgi:hypothetical protein